MKKDLNSLLKFIPKSLIPLLKENKDFTKNEGIILFVDICGFTALTERLATIGKEGAEELTYLLNRFFEKMVDITINNGGDIIRFGGDSMTILFPPKMDLALKTSFILKEECRNFHEIRTKIGKISLFMKIGISYGNIVLGIVGDDSTSFDYFLAGEALNKAVEAEHHAKKDEIIIHPDSHNLVNKRDYVLEINDEGFISLKGLTKKGVSTSLTTHSLPNENVVAKKLIKFLPYYIVEKAQVEENKLIGEHRKTTTLFCQLSINQFDKKEDIEKINKSFIAISKIVKRYGGIINKLDMGDKGTKILALFGTPVPIENQEEHAIKCAIEIRDDEYFKKMKIDFNIGITTSPLFSAFIGSKKRRELTVMGDGINLAARLMTANIGEKILVTKELFEKTNHFILFKHLGAISVKGKSEKIEVYSPIRIKDIETTESKFVGRSKELKLSKDFLLKDNNQALLAIVSEAGGGKTSFMSETKRMLEENNFKTISMKLAPYDKEKFFTPIKNILISLLKLDRENKSLIKEKLYSSLSRNDQKYFPVFKEVFSLDIKENTHTQNLKDRERKELLFAIVSRLILSFLTKEIYFIFIDNIDYADPSSKEFIIFLSDELSKTKSKIIFSLREGNCPLNKELIDLAYMIKLNPFTKEEIENYLIKIENFAFVPNNLIDFLFKKSKGNPRFIVELVSVLKKSNIAFLGPSKKFEIDEDKLFQTHFPDSLEGLFLSKVETLGENEKMLLKKASILGTSFSIEALSVLANKNIDNLILDIKSLEDTNLVKIDTWGHRPYATFIDPLLRDALYNSLNYKLKRELHLKIAKYLEKEAEISPRVIPVLARHYEAIGNIKKTLHYLILSAKYYKSLYDYRSAFEYLSKYISIVEKSPLKKDKNILEAYFIFAEVLHELGKFEEAEKYFNMIIKNIKENSQLKIKALAKLAENKRKEGKIEEAIFLNQKALKGAKRFKDHSLKTVILLYQGVTYAISQQMKKAKQNFIRAQNLAKKFNDFPNLVLALMNRGLVEYLNGNLIKATELLYQALKIGKEKNLLSCIAQIYANLANLLFELGNYQKALKICKEAEEISNQFGYKNHLLESLTNRALLETMLGMWSQAKRSLENALNTSLHYKVNYFVAVSLNIKSIHLYIEGKFSKSFEIQKESFNLFKKENHIREALGSLSEILSITNEFNLKELASPIIEENLNFFKKEIENKTNIWTVNFFANYVFHKFLKKEIEFEEAEQNLIHLLEKAKTSKNLWHLAEISTLILSFYKRNEKLDKAYQIGSKLYPYLKNHFCPLITPKFLLNFSEILLKKNDEKKLKMVLKDLQRYEKYLKSSLRLKYLLLLYKFDPYRQTRRIKNLFKLVKRIASTEENQTFKEAFLNLDYVNEIISLSHLCQI